ncbi:8272_t:CDS:1, partial [Gigaspora rosea]
GYKLDKERFTAINIHQQYNIPQQGCSKGPISRNLLSNKRKGKLSNNN